MSIRSTHTYAIMELSPAAYAEIRSKLIEAGYSQSIMREGELDMDGLAVALETAAPETDPQAEEERLP